jgi:hypothetical protein
MYPQIYPRMTVAWFLLAGVSLVAGRRGRISVRETHSVYIETFQEGGDMTHHLELSPWLRKTRSVFGRFALIAVLASFVGEMAYSSLANGVIFSGAEEMIGKWLPWIESVSALVLVASLSALASTWWAKDWWVDRWARTHENFVS